MNTNSENFWSVYHRGAEERIPIFEPVLARGELLFLYAPRGLGKTYFALTMAHRASKGESFMGWGGSGSPMSTIYFDGEMGHNALARRMAPIMKNEHEASMTPFYLTIKTLDDFNGKMPNLSDPAFQHYYDQAIDINNADLIFIDNLFTCSRPLHSRDGEVEQWERIQDWLLKHRNRGRSIVLIHHAGKSGTQYGSVKHETVVNTSIALVPTRIIRNEGAKFELRFDKGRDLMASDMDSLAVKLTTDFSGAFRWEYEKYSCAEVRAVRDCQMKHGKNAKLISLMTNIPFQRVKEILEG